MSGAFGAYILSVTGAVLLFAAAETVMLEGQTAKYVRGALSLVLTLVILSPLAGLFREGSAALSAGDSAAVSWDASYDTVYIDALNDMKAKQQESAAQRYLTEKGFSGAVVSISYTGDKTGITVIGVRADASALVIPDGADKSAYLDKLADCLAGCFDIDKGRVLVYGTD